MANEDAFGEKRSRQTHRGRSDQPETPQGNERVFITAERSGDWIPAEELRREVQTAMEAGHDVTIDLERLEHLDGSALQVLLALNREQKKRGRELKLGNASPILRQWFDYAGTTSSFDWDVTAVP